MTVRRNPLANGPAEPLQPAQHDLPEGPGLEWEEGDIPPEDLVDDASIEASTELVADGSQEAGD